MLLYFRVPIVPIKLHFQEKSISNDLSSTLPASIYCMIINNLKQGCLQYNLIDIWKYDLKTIQSLTIDDVLLKINTTMQRCI